jgi:hypothetical protein
MRGLGCGIGTVGCRVPRGDPAPRSRDPRGPTITPRRNQRMLHRALIDANATARNGSATVKAEIAARAVRLERDR